MEPTEIKEQFEQNLDEVAQIGGVATESATQVATAIMQEAGKILEELGEINN